MMEFYKYFNFLLHVQLIEKDVETFFQYPVILYFYELIEKKD